MTRAALICFMTAITACAGDPCPVATCPFGQHCVRAPMGTRLLCATPCNRNARGGPRTAAQVCGPDVQICAVALRLGGSAIDYDEYCPYGTQELGEVCDDSEECVFGTVCAAELGVCVQACGWPYFPERQICPDGTGCYARQDCRPRCDLPGNSCAEGLICDAGWCREPCDPSGPRCGATIDCDADGLPDCFEGQLCGVGYCYVPPEA